MLTIHVNGEPREVPEGSSVADLVTSLGLEPAQVAVERNREVVGRDARETCWLAAGDRIELVTLVGGG